MSRIFKGGKSPRKSGLRFALTVGLAALVLGLVALAGPAPDTLLGAPCNVDCGTTTGTTTGTTYRTLTITVNGPGSVAESPLTCATADSPCSWKYANLSTAEPAATANSGYTFTGWGGECSGTGSCSILMSANKSVSASFADTTAPPAPNITAPSEGAPASTSGSASISFVRSDGGGATGTSGFHCKLDNSSYSGSATCTSPWSTGALATGTHTVYVWALDPAGNVSGSASRTFRVVNRPDTTIGGTPDEGALVNSTSTAFTYSGGTSYNCTLDGSVVPCANLAPGEGANTLEVSAGISPFGDGITYTDTTPAVRHWTVDSKPPDTSIDSGPPATTTDATAVIAFAGEDPEPGTAIHYECRLDEGIYQPCTSPVTYSVGSGTHTAFVRAIDAAGNVDPSPASRSWKVGSDSGSGGSAGPSGPTTVAPPGTPAGTQGPLPGGSPAEAPAKVGRIRWKAHGSRIELRSLTLARLAAGSRVVVACKGAGCPFKHRKARVRRGKAQLAGLFHHSALRRGTRIRLRITAPNFTPRTIAITIRAHGKPKVAGG
jgi:hypothetical protein